MKTTSKDYYHILGVTQDATVEQIKKAYRKLARRHHPDTNNGDIRAAERFREITEAYEILSDPEQRRTYDRTYRPAAGTGMAAQPLDTEAASRMLAVLEAVWQAIRARHPEIPPVVIILASGSETKQPRWGHHAPRRWRVHDHDRTEIMVSGEGLTRTPREVLGTLLHEAAHALADVRGLKDTSRQGRYHNTTFAKLAEELGIEVAKDTRFGWTITTVPDTTATTYADQIRALEDAMVLWRRTEIQDTPKPRGSNLIAATCPCGRTIRIAESSLNEAPVTCGACGEDFQPK